MAAINNKADFDIYIEEKKVKCLFEALTAGLVFHRPEDHFRFMHDCLGKLR